MVRANESESRTKLLLVEFNEVDPELLRYGAERLDLKNFRRLLSLHHTQTTTADEVEHQGLDPWVQWVGIHTGVPTTEHGIRRLGDTRSQSRPQIWHALADQGHTWGVWGSINAPRGATKGCAFFVPDPWSWDEEALPPSLDALMALPRYVSKNYLDIDRGQAIASLIRSASFFLPPERWGVAVRFVRQTMAAIAKTRMSVHTNSTLIDFLAALLFVQLRRRFSPDFSVIFLNNIAHLQHQFWLSGSQIHPEMELGLRVSDSIVGMLMDDVGPAEALVVMNAFRQENVHGKGFYGYRQKNPALALAALGVVGARVEQCMTHDAHIFFETRALADAAEARLRSCKLGDGTNAFFVDRTEEKHIFYQLDFDRRVDEEAPLAIGADRIPFRNVFEFVAERTGAHVRDGDVYSHGIAVPDHMPNHEMFDCIMRHFAGAASPVLLEA